MAEVARWAGDAQLLARVLPDLQPGEIEKYFVRWTPELLAGKPALAYPGDRAPFGDCWQLIDFLRRCRFAFPEIDDEPPYSRVELSPEVQALVEKRGADRIRFEADRAWRAKDHARVIELLSQVGDDLRPSEQKKLEYSRKSTGGGVPRKPPWWRFWV